ncbi:hypothetical protein DFH07DRAFT_962333 [Mycena maculata]|uniref:Uncharacterized protein n=1 Tax=Mycena maculata TaxID=230809 RepID=A0AAD7ISL2_9AGAR|nr:hypothetical protein DFH07DRAFT_962333 [Mycena maculata]
MNRRPGNPVGAYDVRVFCFLQQHFNAKEQTIYQHLFTQENFKIPIDGAQTTPAVCSQYLLLFIASLSDSIGRPLGVLAFVVFGPSIQAALEVLRRAEDEEEGPAAKRRRLDFSRRRLLQLYAEKRQRRHGAQRVSEVERFYYLSFNGSHREQSHARSSHTLPVVGSGPASQRFRASEGEAPTSAGPSSMPTPTRPSFRFLSPSYAIAPSNILLYLCYPTSERNITKYYTVSPTPLCELFLCLDLAANPELVY